MRHLLTMLFGCALCFAQIPERDARNTSRPHTNAHFSMPVYKTQAGWDARKNHLRKQILSAAGLLPMPEKTSLNPSIFGTIEHEDYTIEKVYLQTLPNYYLSGNLYRPRGRQGKLPAIATPHGHWTYGRLENSEHASVPARCINLAQQGYVVFAYDMVGYTDTIQTPHAFGNQKKEQLWSFGPLGLQLWNSIRVVDFLLTLPEVDSDRIGATGASGGGTQTFLLAAVDDRVKFSAPVNMISAIMQGGSPCENAPHLRLDTSNLEIGAMMAPRPMLMVSATGDWTRNTPKEEFPAIRGIYELYGQAGNLETVQIDAPHNYNKESREAVYSFFGRRMLKESGTAKFEERRIRLEKLGDMMVFHGRELPRGAVNFQQLFAQWVASARKQVEETNHPDSMRERLALAMGTEWPETVLSQSERGGIILSRKDRGDRVPGLWRKGSGDVYLALHPEGAKAAFEGGKVRDLLARGASVLAIDAFQTGRAREPRAEPGRHDIAFNRTDDANRVQDVLTALAFLSRAGAKTIRITAEGDAAVWALFAAAVSPVRVTLDAGHSDFRGEDADFEQRFFIPGIQRAGGLRAAERLTGATR